MLFRSDDLSECLNELGRATAAFERASALVSEAAPDGPWYAELVDALNEEAARRNRVQEEADAAKARYEEARERLRKLREKIESRRALSVIPSGSPSAT